MGSVGLFLRDSISHLLHNFEGRDDEHGDEGQEEYLCDGEQERNTDNR